MDDNIKRTEKIGLFGGTFAPPHLGHVHAAQTMLDATDIDRLIIMPTAIPPHKTKAGGDTPELRLEMCREAFGHLPKTEISSYEIEKGGISYTVKTLEHLRTPENRVYLLCGSDMFLTLDTWFQAERIFELSSIVCVPRYDKNFDRLMEKKKSYEERFAADIQIIGADPFVASSTEIREIIASHGDLTKLLPEGVIEVIRREKLYCGAGE